APFPVRRTDLKALAPAENVLVWFGHSSYFLQVNGKRFLIDPVLSGNASPVRWTTRAFSGSDVYTVDDLPDIDYLLLSHDHYDHLDYRTVKSLQPRVGRVITGLGVGAHLEHWGYSAQQVRELDWFEDLELTSGFLLQALPARHFSGRQFRRNNTLWVSFALTTPSFRLYLGGDSGYGDHFKTIGERCGPFDLALLENGQYNAAWKYIHMMPEEVAQAAADLQARRLMPVHWGKFALSTHTWQEPITRVTAAAREKGIPLLHPMIGEPVHLDAVQEAAEWWRGNS
ncbi:MAG TPA: MBL fold metallo-hydrolase, partial [Chitinophagaceae bacterium]|nr:MBL fold metallo-hydrolase [Chitinophagaceae bacterium]